MKVSVLKKLTLSANTQGILWSFLKYLSYSWLISWLINTFYTSKYLFSYRCSCLETWRWIGSVHSCRLVFRLGCSLGFSQKEKLVSSILDINLSFVISDTITYLLVSNLYLAIFFVWIQTIYIYTWLVTPRGFTPFSNSGWPLGQALQSFLLVWQSGDLQTGEGNETRTKLKQPMFVENLHLHLKSLTTPCMHCWLSLL